MTLLELTIHCQVNHLHPGVFLGLKMIFPQACSQSPWWPILLKQLHMCIRAQSCLTLCTLMDCNLLGSSVHGILQARMLEWGSLSLLQGTQVSHIAGGFFTIWATREALEASGLFCCCVASVVSNSVRPHRRKPTRLCRPWDSPGKNTGVGCYFLLQCIKMKSEKWKGSRSVMSDS